MEDEIDWELTEKIIKILHFFQEVLTFIEGSKYPTFPFISTCVYGLKAKLQNHSNLSKTMVQVYKVLLKNLDLKIDLTHDDYQAASF